MYLCVNSYDFIANLYPWVYIHYDFHSESIPMGIMSRGGICLPVTPVSGEWV